MVKEEKEMIDDKGGRVTEQETITIRKEKAIKFFKTNYQWISYAVLAFIVYLTIKIRLSNLAGLKDITTGTWTLGPDLDPFLFLRWAKYIVENGNLMIIDTLRYVPLGYNTSGEYLLLPYLIAWFHKLATIFGSESVTYSAIIFPAFAFGLTIISFFFLTRKIFLKKLGGINANLIALVASFIFSVIPVFLPRTIAGIPEKESAAFLFLFLAFYLFLCGWESKDKYKLYIYSILAGISTAFMAHIWGGNIYIFYTLVPAVFLAFLAEKVDKNKLTAYGLWILSSFILMITMFSKYSFGGLISSLTMGSALMVFIIISFDMYARQKIFGKRRGVQKLPPKLVSLLAVALFIVIISSIFFGLSYIPEQISNVKDALIKPATSRLIQTVAENRQPYFTEWAGSFGPLIKSIPVTFWLFFVGSIYLFYNLVTILKQKERIILTLSYLVFLLSLVFSRYSSNSRLNGESGLSLFVYVFGFVVFLVASIHLYYRYFKKGELNNFKEIDFGFILLFIFFFLGIISARAGVRFIMMLAPPASIIIAFFLVYPLYRLYRTKENNMKMAAAILLIIFVVIPTLFSANIFYNQIKSEAPYHVPSSYTQQWQKAMGWVRDNTPQNAVFGHWWDYGYWLQSMGERATVLDGGNAIAYWNHLMGRHALTGSDNQEALEFLYAHDTTHFLIDSTDIGKYSAFSTIGSDINYDRASFIPTFYRDPNQLQEKKNSTVLVYTGGVGLDEDIIYEDNTSKIFLPAGAAGLGAILIERDTSSGEIITSPMGIFVYQGKQYSVPFRYVYHNKKFTDFGSGIESGVYIYPRLTQSPQGALEVDIEGALLYLSKRTVKSQLARLYLYGEDNENFELVHSEDDPVVAQIRTQNPNFEYDIIDYGGLRGPIAIWEIKYPKDIELNEDYLSIYYPPELSIAK